MVTEMELGLKEPKYLNPLVDYGFKRIFGSETYKELLIDFLNKLIEDQGKIISLNYLPPEQLGQKEEDRKAIFDIEADENDFRYMTVVSDVVDYVCEKRQETEL